MARQGKPCQRDSSVGACEKSSTLTVRGVLATGHYYRSDLQETNWREAGPEESAGMPNAAGCRVLFCNV